MDRILVVDDDESVRDLLISFFETHGFSAQGAENGRAGLALARTINPRVVLLDIIMPGLNGLETLGALKIILPETIVIMMSGVADQESALEALNLGAYDFIEKPFDLDYLERVLLVKLATN